MILDWLKKLAAQHAPLRPPGALFPEEVFENTCIRCRRCVEVCPYQSIQTAHGEWGLKMGTPYVVPREVPCYLCMKCMPVCPTGALAPLQDKTEVKMGLAVINRQTCMAYNSILCRACYERCPIYREAVILKEELFPEVVQEKCVGCGICENVCPTDPPSIVVFSRHEHKDQM